MKPIELIPINKKFSVYIPDNLVWEVSEEIERRVDTIWKEEQNVRTLENRNTLVLIAVEKNLLIAQFVHYKYVLAVHTDLELRKELNITAVGVSGITECQGHLLIGKRTGNVTQYKNCYETAPSGGIEEKHFKEGKLDYMSQILDELKEETEITADQVLSKKELFLAHDLDAHSIDICMRLDVDPKVLENSNFSPNSEYSEILWVHESNLLETLRKGDWVPLSRELCTFIKAL